jgi:hypothetical protein
MTDWWNQPIQPEDKNTESPADDASVALSEGPRE